MKNICIHRIVICQSVKNEPFKKLYDEKANVMIESLEEYKAQLIRERNLDQSMKIDLTFTDYGKKS